MQSAGNQDGRAAHNGKAGQDEVTPDGAQRSSTPGQQGAYAREHKQEQTDGHGDAVKERRAHCYF